MSTDVGMYFFFKNVSQLVFLTKQFLCIFAHLKDYAYFLQFMHQFCTTQLRNK